MAEPAVGRRRRLIQQVAALHLLSLDDLELFLLPSKRDIVEKQKIWKVGTRRSWRDESRVGVVQDVAILQGLLDDVAKLRRRGSDGVSLKILRTKDFVRGFGLRRKSQGRRRVLLRRLLADLSTPVVQRDQRLDRRVRLPSVVDVLDQLLHRPAALVLRHIFRLVTAGPPSVPVLAVRGNLFIRPAAAAVAAANQRIDRTYLDGFALRIIRANINRKSGENPVLPAACVQK